MSTSRIRDEAGPGLTRQAYLDLLETDGYTGWYDERGIPAPWPEDFSDPGSGWQVATGGAAPADVLNQPF